MEPAMLGALVGIGAFVALGAAFLSGVLIGRGVPRPRSAASAPAMAPSDEQLAMLERMMSQRFAEAMNRPPGGSNGGEGAGFMGGGM